MSMYFGSENVVEALKEGLNPTLTGISKDQQFGSGFYFFENAMSAKEQIGKQGLKVVHPVIMSANVELENPVKLERGQTIHDAVVNASPKQIHQIMLHSERIFDIFSPLLEWKGIDRHRLSKELIQEACEHYALPENFWDMEKELFGDLGEAKIFRAAVNETLGYDGVTIVLGDGIENKVAWFKEQVSDIQVHEILPAPEPTNPAVRTQVQVPCLPNSTQNRIN